MSLTLEQRVRMIEDVEEIRKLKWRYCNFSDRGWGLAGTDYGAWAALFVDDAIYFTNGLTPTFTSRVALDEWNTGLRATKAFSFHLVGNGHIEVTADAATGKWHALTPVTDPQGTVAIWSAGVFEDEFRRTADGWRIAKLSFRPAFVAPFQGAGWVGA
jgi:hypothetical protein